VYYYPDFFSWRVELRKKESDANLTNHSIIIILNNILPAHIGESQNGLKSQTKINYLLYLAVDVYINSMAKHELYYENYQMVSVMFAMLINFEMDLRSLRILNEIIAEFDMLVR